MNLANPRTQWIAIALVATLAVGFLGGYAIGASPTDAGIPAASIAGMPAKDKFVLGFVPSERATELTPKAQEMADFLSARLGIPVEVYPIDNGYESLIEALRFGHVDAAFMDSGPAWIAHRSSGAEVVLAEVNKGGRTYYHAEAWALKTSDIHTLDDIWGKRTSHTGMTGTAGMVLPIGTLVAQGHMTIEGDDFIALENALKKYFDFSPNNVGGSYSGALERVLNGDADVAFVADDSAERFWPDRADELRSVHRFGKSPSHPVMVAKDLAPEWRIKFSVAMLELNQPQNIHLLTNIYGVEGLVPTTTEAHLGEFGLALSNLPMMNDNELSKISK